MEFEQEFRRVESNLRGTNIKHNDAIEKLVEVVKKADSRIIFLENAYLKYDWIVFTLGGFFGAIVVLLSYTMSGLF